MKDEIAKIHKLYNKKRKLAGFNHNRIDKSFMNTDIIIPMARVIDDRPSGSGSGRKPFNYYDKGMSAQTKEAAELSRKVGGNTQLLLHAASIAAKQKGEKYLHKRIEKLRQQEPECEPQNVKLSDDEALAMIIDANLTKFSYEIIRSNAINMYPSWKKIFAAKERSFDRSKIFCTESQCYVELKYMVEISFRRILESIGYKFDESVFQHFYFTVARGMDGAGNFKSAEQMYTEEDVNEETAYRIEFSIN